MHTKGLTLRVHYIMGFILGASIRVEFLEIISIDIDAAAFGVVSVPHSYNVMLSDSPQTICFKQ